MAHYRQRSWAQTVTPTGGGGSVPTIGNIVWGPDFGEGAGSDGNTFTVTPSVDLEALKLVGNVTVTPTLDTGSIVLSPLNVTVTPTVDGTALGAPFWQSVSTTPLATPLGATQIVANLPSVVTGELLLAFIATDNTLDVTHNTPTGWNFIAGINFPSTTRISAYWRISDGTEGATQTFTFSGSSLRATAEVHRILGVHQTTPIDVSATGQASVIDPVVPAVTTTAVNCLVFAFAVHRHAIGQAHAAPANHIERTEFSDTNVSQLSSSSYTRVFAATGSTGTATIDCDELVASGAAYMRVAVAPGPVDLTP